MGLLSAVAPALLLLAFHSRSNPPGHPLQRRIPFSVGPNSGQHYTNSSGQSVHVPMQAPSAPSGATAKCRDGSYSFSQHASGTCSHHGGAGLWLRH